MQSELLVNLGLAGIDEGTRSILRETWPVLREAVPVALDAIYGQGSHRPGVKPLFSTDDRMAEARAAQGRHWEALFAARFDEEYAASVSRIALTHVRVGLGPAWFISGYLVALTELHSLLVNVHSESIMSWRARSRMEQAIRAVDKAVLFDLQLGLSAYFAEIDASYRRRLENLAERCHTVASTMGEQVINAAGDLDGTAGGLLDACDAARANAVAVRDSADRATLDIAATASAAEYSTRAILEVTSHAHAAATATAGATAAIEVAARSAEGVATAALGNADAVAQMENLVAETGALVATATSQIHADAGVGLTTTIAQLEAISAQASRAVTELRGRAGRVQQAAASASSAFGDVLASVRQVRGATVTLASAVALQAEAAREMGVATASAARAVAGLSRGSESAVENAARSAEGARRFAAVSVQLRRQAGEQAEVAGHFIDEIRAADRRAEPREPATASVILTIDGNEVRGVLHDVSAGGASVLLDTSRVSDNPGRITVRVPQSTMGADVSVAGRTPHRLNLSFTDRPSAQTFVANVLDRSSSLVASHAA